MHLSFIYNNMFVIHLFIMIMFDVFDLYLLSFPFRVDKQQSQTESLYDVIWVKNTGCPKQHIAKLQKKTNNVQKPVGFLGVFFFSPQPYVDFSLTRNHSEKHRASGPPRLHLASAPW